MERKTALLVFGTVVILLVLTVSFLFTGWEKPKEKKELCANYGNFRAEISCEEAVDLIVAEFGDRIVDIKPLPQFPNEERIWIAVLNNGENVTVTKNGELRKGL